MFATGSSGFGMSPVSVSSLMLGPRARITTWIPASKCVAISSFFCFCFLGEEKTNRSLSPSQSQNKSGFECRKAWERMGKRKSVGVCSEKRDSVTDVCVGSMQDVLVMSSQ